ncbi:MAG TPA: glutamate-5-semialdehyde dehydrogenase [Candidatus Hydrogenedentes bacterium]|nr:glutamate-5-semialdehyde dehydrogenase [Candidatus Hydrogenedentota bacterium]
MNLEPRTLAERARDASRIVAMASGEQKNAALEAMADRLRSGRAEIAAANEADMARAREHGLPDKLVARLRFGDAKIESRLRSLAEIAKLPDPVGKTLDSWTCSNGLAAARVRVPLGVILMVYEARPHVTVNAGAICLKAGNACILRGGSEARQCNLLLGELWRSALHEAHLPCEVVQVTAGSHEDVNALLEATDCINLVIPRGGKELIASVTERSKIPVVKHFEGVCHVYIDEYADLDKALQITLDSKCLMPEVCNAAETVLVHQALTDRLPDIVGALQANGVQVKGCRVTQRCAPKVEPVTEEDWRTEYLDMVVSIRVVNDVGEAIEHIETFGSHHTDAIVTENERVAGRFEREVDSSVVLVNASTMFCDGYTLGMGAEIGISTDKIHARGPMGLRDLTSYKYVLRGTGDIMGEPRVVAGGPR